MQFFHISVLPGSEAVLLEWSGKVKQLLIAYFYSNISAKQYQNQSMHIKSYNVHSREQCSAYSKYSNPNCKRNYLHSMY